MAFKDGMTDTVTIKTTTVTTNAVNTQVKAEATLYDAVPGRLASGGQIPSKISRTGVVEAFKNRWFLNMEPQFNGGNRGDRVTVNGQNYIITRKQEIRGTTTVIHHVSYSLEESE